MEHRLPNGNTVVANWLGQGFLGKQPVLFEVTPDKQVVWQVEGHARFTGFANGHLVDVPGDPAKGELLVPALDNDWLPGPARAVR